MARRRVAGRLRDDAGKHVEFAADFGQRLAGGAAVFAAAAVGPVISLVAFLRVVLFHPHPFEAEPRLGRQDGCHAARLGSRARSQADPYRTAATPTAQRFRQSDLEKVN